MPPSRAGTHAARRWWVGCGACAGLGGEGWGARWMVLTQPGAGEARGSKDRIVGAGARAKAPSRQGAGVRAPRRAQPPAGAGMRVEEVPDQSSGLCRLVGRRYPGLPSPGEGTK